MKTSKKRCRACGFFTALRWGKRLGRQRVECKNCGALFTNNAPQKRLENRFTWF